MLCNSYFVNIKVIQLSFSFPLFYYNKDNLCGTKRDLPWLCLYTGVCLWCLLIFLSDFHRVSVPEVMCLVIGSDFIITFKWLQWVGTADIQDSLTTWYFCSTFFHGIPLQRQSLFSFFFLIWHDHLLASNKIKIKWKWLCRFLLWNQVYHCTNCWQIRQRSMNSVTK